MKLKVDEALFDIELEFNPQNAATPWTANAHPLTWKGEREKAPLFDLPEHTASGVTPGTAIMALAHEISEVS